MKIIAHRGASAAELENSMAAFEKALELGAQVIEMDVRTSLDGHAILMHDETLSRTTRGTGPVSETPLSVVKAIKLRNGQAIPTLKDALSALKGRCIVNIELKDSGSALSAGQVVKEMNLWKDVVFSSFQGSWLVDLKLRYPHARVAFICEDKKLDCVRIATSLKAEAINISMRLATKKMFIKAKKEGLDLNIWVVNSPRGMRKFIEMGADGIITDRPDVLAALLSETRSEIPDNP